MQAIDRVAAVLGGRYRVERELARGGMGIVYVARDTQLGRPVAIKVVADAFDAAHAQRFIREVRVLANLRHPNVVPLYDAGATNGLAWYSMPFIEGESLRERIARGPVEVPTALQILRDVAGALDAAHVTGIVHRDVKPANVLLSGDRALLADFGVARSSDAGVADGTVTATGTAVGSPDYMAPEQMAATTVDERADQFALACVAYEALTGRLPFADEPAGSRNPASPASLTRRFAGTPHPLPAALGGADAVFARALAVDPAQRYGLCADFVAALSGAMQSGGRAAMRPSKPRRTALVAIGVCAAVAAGAVFAARRPTSTTPVRLLVLPIQSDAAPKHEWLAEGLTDELTSHLGRVPNLDVIARTTAARLGNDKRPIGEIARAVDVKHVVTGRLLPEADTNRFRVGVAVVRAGDGTELWSDRIAIDLHDTRRGEAQLVRRVSDGIRDVLGVGATSIHRARTSREVFELLLTAGGGTAAVFVWPPDRLARADSLLRRAIELDQNAAEAHARLALVRIPRLWGALSPDLFNAAFDSARGPAVRALKLDSTNVAANIVMAIVNLANGRLDETQRSAERGLRLRPRDADALELLGSVEFCNGRYEAAREHFKQALKGDPLNPDHASSLHTVELVGFGRAEASREVLEQSLELWDSPGQRAEYGARLLATRLASGGTLEQVRAAADSERVRRPAPWAWATTGGLNREVEWALAAREDWRRVDSVYARRPARPVVRMLRAVAENRWDDARRLAPSARAALSRQDVGPFVLAGWSRELQRAWTYMLERDTTAALAIIDTVAQNRCGRPPVFGYEVALVTYPAIARTLSGDTAGARRGLEAAFRSKLWPTREALRYHPILGPVLGFPPPAIP